MYCTLLIYDSLKGSCLNWYFKMMRVSSNAIYTLKSDWRETFQMQAIHNYMTSAPVCQSLFLFSFYLSFSLSLLCGSSIVTCSDLWPMSKSLVIFVAVLNVTPWAPYQHHNKNSWEQLSMGFNSSLTTEVKIIAQCFQMEVASKELFSYHKLSASLACIP